MPFFPVDDGFAFHRKAVRAGNAAIGLWTRAGSWCNQQLTDGFVPDDVVVVLGTPAQAERLVKAGLWHEAEGGFQFHEWLGPGRNKTRAEVELRRKHEAAKKARARAAKENGGMKYARTAVGPSENEADPNQEADDPFSANEQVREGCPPGTPEGVPGGVPEGVRSTPPLPSKEEKELTPSLRSGDARKRATPAKKATRIPDDFSPTDDMITWARENTPQVGRAATDDFIDYWRAKDGKDAEKRDWVATWRRWMRTEQKRFTERNQRTNGNAIQPSSGSKRMDKALAALAPDDPFRAQYAATQAAVTNPVPANEWLVLEGGRSA